VRKKKIIQTLGLTERVKKFAPRRTTPGMVSVKPNPEQEPLMPPVSNWVRPSELPTLEGVEEFALDIETVDNGIRDGRGPGWAYKMGHVAGVGIAWRTGSSMQSIYVPVSHPDSDNFDKAQVASWLKDVTRKRRVVMFNAGYDLGWLNTDMGIPLPPVIDDASCAAFLVDENRDDLSLDGVCAWRGVPGKDLAHLREAAIAYGYPANKAVANIGRLPARYAGIYGAQDPASTLLVMEDLRLELDKQELGQAYKTEMRLIPLVHAMRSRGIRVDTDRAVEFQSALVKRYERTLKDLGDLLGMNVGLDDVRSHKWLQRTFSARGINATNFDKNWMRRSQDPFTRMVAEIRQCADMAEKFVGTYILDFAHNGRIHATINQWLYEEGGTRSHRLSYADPPLQQAPSRPEPFDGWPLTGENATEYRSCFLPEEGDLWFGPDYSQQEYRHIVADAEKLGCEKADIAAQKYRDDPNTDFHNLVVELTGLQRRHAKDCNFAKSYGAGVPKFAGMTGKTIEEAGHIMGVYDKELPFVRQLSDRCQNAAERRGYIRMFDGARSHFDRWEVSWLPKEDFARGLTEGFSMNACDYEEARERQKMREHPWFGKKLKRAHVHKAMNRRIQGNAARQMKLAMAICGEEGLVPLLQMHDELPFSLPPTAEGERKAKRIVEIMRTCYTCSVPFLVDAEWGTTWGDAKHGSIADALGKAKTRQLVDA
jgi:DNA polymerase I-like protein with 3'-5' exonuclease and polymerase domains